MPPSGCGGRGPPPGLIDPAGGVRGTPGGQGKGGLEEKTQKNTWSLSTTVVSTRPST